MSEAELNKEIVFKDDGRYLIYYSWTEIETAAEAENVAE